MLPDGKILAIGGIDIVNLNGSSGTLATEIWDPDTNLWNSLAPMSKNRLYHTVAMLLPDARVLVAGFEKTAQIFSPPYLFKGERPAIISSPSLTQYGATFDIKISQTQTMQKVNLISLPSVTHALDLNQYFAELSFTQNGDTLNVKSPTNPNTAPPGYYMLFVINTNGIPSVSKMIKIEAVTVTPTPKPTATPTPTNTPTPKPTATPTPNPTATPTPTNTPTPNPTATPLPTATPTPKPTATLTPTNTPTPKPTATPTPKPPTPTNTPPTLPTTLSLNLLLHGIGKGGDNVYPNSPGNQNPLHPQRQITIEIYNGQNQIVLTKQGQIQFNANTGAFTAILDIGTNLNSDVYAIKIKTNQFLSALVPGLQSITKGKTNTIHVTELVTGDVNADNKLSALDYNLLMSCYSDLKPAANCNTDVKLASDLNDDGSVNQIDYNLFIRELSILKGQ